MTTWVARFTMPLDSNGEMCEGGFTVIRWTDEGEGMISLAEGFSGKAARTVCLTRVSQAPQNWRFLGYISEPTPIGVLPADEWGVTYKDDDGKPEEAPWPVIGWIVYDDKSVSAIDIDAFGDGDDARGASNFAGFVRPFNKTPEPDEGD